MDDNIRILFLAADPSDLTRTRLAGEYQTIKEELKKGRYRQQFLLREEFSVKVEDMTRAVKDFRPHIIQFSGHGSMDGDLCLEDSMAKAKRVKVRSLGGIFSRLAGQVDCVVLNACYSARQAVMISRHIPYVIGLKAVITEQAAHCFSLGFYQALSAGETIEGAFQDARALLEAHELLSSVKPVLKVGPGAARPLVGPWGVRVDSEHAAPPSAVRGSPESRNNAEARYASAQVEPRATVRGRSISAGRDILMKASPGFVDADGLEAARDVRLEGSALEES